MATLPIPFRAGWRIGLACVLASVDAAHAQEIFRVSPIIGVAQMYDSNLFSTPVDRQADFITRVTPGVESEYRSTLVTLVGRYAFDIERFADHRELTSTDARARATIDSSYRPTRRLALTGGAEFSKTHTPGELSGETGLTLTRALAQQLTVRSSITRELGRVTVGTMDYSFTRDHLEGGFGMRGHAAAIGARRRVSARDTMVVDYRVQQFLFKPDEAARTGDADVADARGAARAITSHTLSFGWTHAITRQTRLSIDAGPRVTNGMPTSELSLSVQYRMRPLDLAFGYARNQTTVIGLAGTAETQSVTASAGWSLPRPSLHVEVSPRFYQTVQPTVRQDVYRLAIDIVRPIAHGLSLHLALDASVQSGSLYAAPAQGRLARQALTISLAAVPAVRH